MSGNKSMVPTVGEILRCSTLTNCTVGKYSLINPSPLCFFGEVFWHEQLIKFFLASTCDFSSLPPSLPPYYSQLSSQPSHLNVVSTSPVIILGDLDFQFSFLFFSFSGRGTLHNTSILSTSTSSITPFSDTRKGERARQEEDQKKIKKKTSFLVSAVFEPKHTYVHTYIPPYVHT